MDIRNRAFAGAIVLIMVMSTALLSLPVTGARTSYEYYIWGSPDDVSPETSPGLLLAGGSNDVPAGMEWMIEKSGGGDFVVIRCAGTDAYNPWIFKQLDGSVDSCETIIFVTSEACDDPFVLGKIRNAEALFIAGGDQRDYVNMWKGTQVEDVIHDVVLKGAPVGGTSAGLAVLGEFVFSAENDTVYSDDALENPYNRRVALARDFLVMPNMDETITDSHFVARDRMGRLVVFLARIVQDGWADQARGIGIDEKTALGVEPNGDVTMFSLCKTSGGAAYFLSTPGMPEVCEERTPLTYLDMSVYKITDSSTFNLATWTGTGGTTYYLSAVDGVLTSTQPGGEIY